MNPFEQEKKMAKVFSKRTLFLTIFLICSLFLSTHAQVPHRYFDNPDATSEQVVLTILYPSIGSIRALVNLRERGMFNIDNLLVIGVYHEIEMTPYRKSFDLVERDSLSWIRFHQISGELNKSYLFQKNPCSAEFEKIFTHSDGIIFFGGADIPPYIYEKKTRLLTSIDTPYRSFLETSFIFHLLGGWQNKSFVPLLEKNPNFPILGICLGAQSLNVGAGGTLVQDIWMVKYQKKYLEDVIRLGRNRWHTNPLARLYPEEDLISYNMHPIKLSKNGKFVARLGFSDKDQPFVISAHHQAAGKLGRGIKVIATSLDGKVAEAIEHEKYPNVLGVQFHPEFPILYDPDKTYKFTPQDKDEVSLISILENNPPSLVFHQKIWEWFGERLMESHELK